MEPEYPQDNHAREAGLGPIWEKDPSSAASQKATGSTLENIESKRSVPADWMMSFTVGNDYEWDAYLLAYDARATRAHANGLHVAGILLDEELSTLLAAIDKLDHAIEDGQVLIRPEDEDCHTVIERFLTEVAGDVGRKVHTGRSRNDQVVAALRLFLRDVLYDTVDQVCTLGDMTTEIGVQFEKAELPGYTHMQRAMPSTLGLWGMGYAEVVTEDLTHLHSAIAAVNRSPLGSAAGYGVPYLVLPREQVAEELGFASVQENVTAVQLSRGKIEMAVVHALLQVGASLNRMASDLVLFSSAEFRFVELPVEYSTGSSIMPQKRNPDVFELIRANYHRLVAEMSLLMTSSANLTSGYHRDLQLTKESVMRSCFVLRSMLQAMNTVLPVVQFQTENMKKACTDELYATAYAMKLVKKGIPFRTAYREAAANKTGWSDERAVAGQTGYKIDGYPGRAAVDSVRQRIQESRSKVAAYWG